MTATIDAATTIGTVALSVSNLDRSLDYYQPDILMLITGFNPGTTTANVMVLVLMHVVAWAIAVGMLTRLARSEA